MKKKSQVKLALTKLPAKSKHKGSILIISGGPGLPGINPYINFDWPVTNLRESWDIIDLILEASAVHSDNKLPAIRYRDSGKHNRKATSIK